MYEQPQFPPQPPTPPKRKTGLIVGIIVGVIVLLLCLCGIGVVIAWRSGVFESLSTDPYNAKAGDCVTETVKADGSDAKLIACSKPDAKYKVLGVIDDVTESEFDSNTQRLCRAYPDWENVIWLGRQGGNGKALCLAPNK